MILQPEPTTDIGGHHDLQVQSTDLPAMQNACKKQALCKMLSVAVHTSCG